MSAEKFKIDQVVTYTIKSNHGAIECKGLKGLESHIESVLGAFVDKMTGNRTGNTIKGRLQDHQFLLDNRQELETIFAMYDAVTEIKTPPDLNHDCSDFYCNRCGSSSEIEYTGN